MKTIHELTLCTYCWCMTKSIEHEDIGDVVCAKCGEYKHKEGDDAED